MSEAGEIFRNLVARLTRETRFHGFYLYEVTDNAPTSKPSLIPVEGPPGLPSTVMPDQLACPTLFGVPGARAELVKGARVLVGFQGGNPGRPFVGFHLENRPGSVLPSTVTLDATSTLTLGGDGAVEAARAPELQSWAALVHAFLADVKAQLAAAGHPTTLTAPSLSAAVAAVKVRVE